MPKLKRELKYYLKHKYRISAKYNSHSDTHPWFGMGQGASDACNRWVIGSNSMANAYQEQAQGWIIPSPIPNDMVTLKLKAFIDDVNLFIGQNTGDSENKFYDTAQQDINQWHSILKATGGELNTKKCFWSNYHLQYNAKGFPMLRTKTPEDKKLTLTNSDGTTKILKSTQSTEGICHLGVHISMDSNQTAKTKILYKRCRMFQKVYSQCPLT